MASGHAFTCGGRRSGAPCTRQPRPAVRVLLLGWREPQEELAGRLDADAPLPRRDGLQPRVLLDRFHAQIVESARRRRHRLGEAQSPCAGKSCALPRGSCPRSRVLVWSRALVCNGQYITVAGWGVGGAAVLRVTVRGSSPASKVYLLHGRTRYRLAAVPKVKVCTVGPVPLHGRRCTPLLCVLWGCCLHETFT